MSDRSAAIARDLDACKKIGAEIAAKHADDVDQKARFPREALDALKAEKLLSTSVPVALGGHGATIADLSEMCTVLGAHCSATSMVFAMHHIQIASIARHMGESAYLRAYLQEVVEKQLLIASITSELGVGGNLRTSVCAVERDGDRCRLKKDATTISYGAHADEWLTTCRRAPDAPPGDQVMVLHRKADTTLEQISQWDTIGMRGTCSPGFKMSTSFPADAIIPDFADAAARTMVPYSHVLWGGTWLGIATGAVNRARAFVRQQSRQTPGTTPPTAVRLAEVAADLQAMRSLVHDTARECEAMLEGPAGADAPLATIGWAVRLNNLKVAASEMLPKIVHKALMICGIAGYKNDGKFALGRHIRDSHSAALMIGNDRLLHTNASLHLVLKDE
jgi:acyl-CoA dehydrogenase